MKARILSRPLPRLAVLTLIAIHAHFQNAFSVELSTQESLAISENLELEFVLALLTPLSQLVESPYADDNRVDNPLMQSVLPSTNTAMEHDALSKPPVASLAWQSYGMLEHGVEKFVPVTDVAPPEVAESALQASNLEHPNDAPLMFKTSLAMSAR
jgi:hypothetical protein